MTPRSYCVVGGGISGLTSAYRLRQAVGDDATITLFEPADRLGGVLRTEHIGGQPMDLGAEAFVLRRPEMPALLAELGLSDRQLASTGARPLIYSQQRLHPLPPQTVVGIPSSAGSMAGLVDDATLARIDAEAARPFTWQVGSDPAVADLVADRFGDQVVARSVDPLLSGVYAGSAATIGLRAATLGAVFGALDGGYQVLLDGLVRRSRVHWVRARVVQLERGWVLRDETGGRWQADAVILAVPAPRLARLVDGIAPRTHAAARQIVSASSAVVALAVPGGTAFPHCSGVLVAGDESPHAKAITLSSRKWGQRGDVALLRLSFGRFGDEPALTASDDQLLAWAADDLVTVFGVAVDPVDVRVRRWIEAMPQYGPGHADVVAELRAGLPPTLAVAGSYLDGIGVPACVGAAGRAVTSVIEALDAQVAR